jgi:WD40 repeat protein
VTGSGTRVTFFNVPTGAEIVHFAHRHLQTVTGLAWAARGPMSVVSGGADKRAIVWDTKNYELLTLFTLHTAPIEAVSWSADGQTVASSSDGGVVRVWNGASAQQVHGLYLDAAVPMRAAAFAPLSNRLAVGGDDGVVRLWDSLTCQVQLDNGGRCADVPLRLRASQRIIRTLAWSPDGTLLAVGADDGVVTIWQPAQSQKSLFTLPQQATVYAISWSADGKRLAVATGNRVTLWSLK